MSLLKARFSRSFGADNCSLCGTGLIADGKSGYFTLCLDLKVIRVVCQTKEQPDEWAFGFLPTMGMANSI